MTLRLPAFCFLLLFGRRAPTVMDPVLHCRIDLTKAGIAARTFQDGVQKTRARTKNAPREWDRLSSALSSSAKADDPVITALPVFTGYPAFAGYDRFPAEGKWTDLRVICLV